MLKIVHILNNFRIDLALLLIACIVGEPVLAFWREFELVLRVVSLVGRELGVIVIPPRLAIERRVTKRVLLCCFIRNID